VNLKAFFDSVTSTLSYVVFSPASKEALVIDPVWDFDPASGALFFDSAQKIEAYLRAENLEVKAILETHAHADHLSSAQFFKQRYPKAQLLVTERITMVQKMFGPLFYRPNEIAFDGSQFDRLIADDQPTQVGSFVLTAIPTPGHTPACTSYLMDGNLFVGDSIFMPDAGTGRCDFPGGSAEQLYQSITQKIYALPDETKIFVGHDYQPNGRDLRYETTVGEQKRSNIHLRADTAVEDFVSFRQKRDASLGAPRLLYPSIQVNINAGLLPAANEQGRQFLKIPLELK
jgi:glyoxylase-like metal-dependent hydrolase (beta-lactamase superfamily II)